MKDMNPTAICPKSFIKTIVAFSLMLVALPCIAGDIHFIENGKSDYSIILPSKMESGEVKKFVTQAARRLQEAFKEAAGVDIPIVVENAYDVTKGHGIFLAQTDYMHSQGLNTDDYKGFDYLIATRGKNIILSGANRHSSGWLWQKEYMYYTLGTVKAIVEFMRTYMHTEFLMPGVVGTSTPKATDLTIPENLTFKGHVKLKLGGGWNDELMYDYANSNYGFGTVYHYRGHTYPMAVSKRKYAESHPEYFAMVRGKRETSLGHLCISNPEVQELIYKDTLKHLDDGAELCELAQTDGYIACTCPNCANFGGTKDPAEQLWIFHRQLAERLKKDRPDKAYLIIAYTPTWDPPKSFDTFPGNVYIELCHYTPDAFDKWSRIKGIKGFTAYLYNWGEYLMPGITPKRSPKFCANQAKLFNERNVIGFFHCGFGELFGTDSPGYYVYGNLIEHPEQDWRKLAQRFYDCAFQEASAPMRGFYEKLYERLDAFWTLEASAKDLTLGIGSLLPSDPRVLITYVYSADMLQVLELKLAGAERIAKNPKVKKRLELVRAEFEYIKALAKSLHFYTSYRLEPNWTTFEQLAKQVEARTKLIDSYYDDKGQMKPFPGWPDIRFLGSFPKSMVMTNGRGPAALGTPFGWNYNLLRSKKYLPGATTVSMIIRKVAFQTGFDFENGCWKNAEWHQLNEMQPGLGILTEQTRFKAIYDDNALHFAVECEMAPERKIKPVGHDGHAWLQDCIELTIDPYGQRQVSYHLICNPVPNSFFDGARGLISDPLHPLYGNEDSGWNGKWHYENDRQGNIWRCVISVPFASINAPVPTPGVRWAMNIGRQAYTSPKMKWAGECALWSPNFESMSMNNLNALGNVTFE